jgi:quercetin dioxygenase-like cupin family protein
MALLATVSTTGRLQITVYFYEHAGDELPVHVHTEDANHITIISVGSFRVTGDPAIAGNILMQGMVVDWPAGQQHGFVALSDGCRMIQIRK